MLRLDIPITKVDAAKRLVYGLATAEIPDRAGEVCDYASTKPFYEQWSQALAGSTGGRSFGNLRAMHGAVAAGLVTAIAFNDEAKQIEICAKVVDDAEWRKVEEGVYTGFSQGGRYARRWTDEAGATRYTADPQEISLVDLPCLAEARFEMIKADGSHQWRGFKHRLEGGAHDGADLAKIGGRNSAEVSKIGARNSAADAARIQTMHDTAVDLGASCAAAKIDGPQRDGPRRDGSADLAATLSKRLDDRLDGLGALLVKTLSDVEAHLDARLKAIEAQPQPLPYASVARAVAKHEDGRDLDRLLDDPAALSVLAIKLAQRQAR